MRQMSHRARVRPKIFKRDGYKCFYCGFHADKETDRARLTIDHIIPLSKGGKTNQSNLVTACRRCNQQKGSRILRHVAKVRGIEP